MSDYPTLFDDATFVAVSHPDGATIDERFVAFHHANPWVYTALVRLARDELRYGPRTAIDHLFSVLRWQHRRHTEGDEFKLNNNFRSRYARLIAASEPDLADAFETRVLRAA